MVFDVIHAAVACIPWGSFATLQPLPDASWSQDPSFAAIAPIVVFSTQVGSDRASSSQAAASSGTAVADAIDEDAPPEPPYRGRLGRSPSFTARRPKG